MSAAVVRLSTAAPRKVQQRWNKHTRAMRQELPQFPQDRSRFAFFPQMHEAMKEARLILDCEPTAAIRLAMSLFLAADDRTKRRVEMFLALQAGSEAAKQALAMVRLENGDQRHKLFVSRAIDLITSGEVE